MGARIALSSGALAPSVTEQLAEQGLWAPSAELHERVRQALCLLRIQSYIPKAVHDRACQRLINAVAKEALPLEKLSGGAR